MGYLHQKYVEQGGRLVLDALKSSDSVNYMDVAIDKDTGEWIDSDMPTFAIDIAIEQLMAAKLCTEETLDELMPDGLQHYRINVTDKGKDFLKSGADFNFQSSVL